jgi:hypothetical protein
MHPGSVFTVEKAGRSSQLQVAESLPSFRASPEETEAIEANWKHAPA